MSRLITFGCSNTEGTGLGNPKTESWTFHLSKLLNLQLVNKGVGASSNKLISHNVTTFEYQPDDTAIVLWSFPGRYSTIDSPEKYYNFLPSHTFLQKDEYYYREMYSEYDHEFMNKVWTTYSVNFLKKNKIKFYQLVTLPKYIVNGSGEENLIRVFHKEFRTSSPLAPDNVHMGKEGNLKYAYSIHNFLHNNIGKI